MAMDNKSMVAVLVVIAIVIVSGAAAFAVLSDDKKINDPVTLIDGAGRTVTITSSDRIASTSVSMTEMICGVGGFSKLAGVTVDTNNFVTQGSILGIADDEFPKSVVSGLDNKTIADLGKMYGISAESILLAEPDLVIMGGGSANSEATIAQLESMGIPIVICRDNSSLENFYFNIELIGKAIGKESGAEVLLGQMKSAIKKISDWTKSIADIPSVGVFITFSETGAYACGEEFYKGTVLIEMLGGVNAFNISGMYLLVSHEGIMAVDPSIIISGTSSGPVEYIKTDPILKSLSAVKSNRVYSTVDTCNAVFSSTSLEFVNAIALMAMFMYEDHLGFEIEHAMGDNYMEYLNLFWEQINA